MKTKHIYAGNLKSNDELVIRTVRRTQTRKVNQWVWISRRDGLIRVHMVGRSHLDKTYHIDDLVEIVVA